MQPALLHRLRGNRLRGQPMKITCPKCKTPVPADRCNVGTDVALCERCDELFALSALLAAGDVPDDFDVHDAPHGAWFENASRGWRLGATTRSAGAFVAVPFLCLWCGIGIWAIYSPLESGEFNPASSLLGILVVGLFLVIITPWTGWYAIMTVGGKVVVTTEDDDGRLFVGVGLIGWTWRFNWASVSVIAEEQTYYQSGNNGPVIALVGKSRLQFGSMLSDARRYYLLQCLRKCLMERKAERGIYP